ncbi:MULTISPECIES: AzlD domain-containing protein [Paenibacillus]|uniref:Branched-chain amino acid ABC transporter n=1 Tax=Paenibacillus naphthalenovorans TaxID=162209 RepID=A0A0U2VX76_9BACL|nr:MULTISPECIES: AzlD domain-containing protein [Paenibacillus]ALS24087.1 branched-chain amino acid ABC transporter [Paenibacillus naphthalenovorans]NTZ19864.1 AzlD domain-containing protein [Paenibacillus sp. JMULE4]GCL72305.1 AzlD domain-containing protein [Paenibacillus naphthalenovorans]SDJ21253.1 Branched-chain amino acid transport protein [Paenibacillus naphthalenovorans]
MEVRWDILLIIIGASLVTFIPRVVPLMVLSRIPLPDWALQWLKHVPIAVMAALVGQELFVSDSKLVLWKNVDLAAGLLTFIVAIKTRSLLWTVIAGTACAMVLRMVFHS